MRRIVLAACFAAGLGAATSAHASITIDFSGLPDNSASYTESGVTFTPQTPGLFDVENAPNGTPALIARDGNGDFPALRADFSALANFVSVDIGDFGTDADFLYLRAFDAANNLLGAASYLIPPSFEGMHTLSVAAANIDYVLFGGSGQAGSSVYSDNFTFEIQRGVPEPGTWALMLLGFGGLGGVLRARRQTSAA